MVLIITNLLEISQARPLPQNLEFSKGYNNIPTGLLWQRYKKSKFLFIWN